MKVPIAALALFAITLLIHPRRLLSPPGAIAFLLLALSPNYRVQIGVRFMFTMVVLGYIAVAVAVARGWASSGSRFVPRWFVAAILTAMAATSVWVWPHGLSYFNQLWGGPSAGEHLLHDSNYDWGQGIPELKAWCESRNEPVAVWYYGMDPAANEPPFTAPPEPLRTMAHAGVESGAGTRNTSRCPSGACTATPTSPHPTASRSNGSARKRRWTARGSS